MQTCQEGHWWSNLNFGEKINSLSLHGFKTTGISRDEIISFSKDLERTLTPGSCIQFLRADTIAGVEHLTSASWHAIRTWEKKVNIARTLGLEVLLFASAQRQIDRALEILGLPSYPSDVVVVIISSSFADNKRVLDQIIASPNFSNAPDVLRFKTSKIQNIIDAFGLDLYVKGDFSLNSITDQILSLVAVSMLERSFPR